MRLGTNFRSPLGRIEHRPRSRERHHTARLVLAGVIACALAAAGCVAAPLDAGAVSVRTAHFDVLSQADPATTGRVARDLELFRAAVREMLSERAAGQSEPDYVYLLSGAAFARLGLAGSARGVTVASEDQLFMVLDLSDLATSLRAARHDYVHHVLRRGSQLPHPPWYAEGLAELLSLAVVEPGQVLLGRVPLDHVELLRYGEALDLREILAARDLVGWAEARRDAFFAGAWAWLSYLQLGHLVGAPNRQEGIRKYLEAEAAGLPVELAALEAFGRSVRDLDIDLRKFVATEALPIARRRTSAANDVAHGAVVPAPRHVAARRLGALALTLGQTALAETLYAEALSASPGDPEATLGLAATRAVSGAPSEALFARAAALGAAAPRIDRARETIQLARAFAAGTPPEGELELIGRAIRAHRRRGIDLDQIARYAGRATTHEDLFRSSELDLLEDLLDPNRRAVVGSTPRLTIASPANEARIRSPVAWVEIVGQAGFGAPPRVDIVFALDRTGSTRRAAARGGSIFDTELLTLQRLLSGLDPRTSRAAVVAFGKVAEVVYPLGNPREALGALAESGVVPELGMRTDLSTLGSDLGSSRDTGLFGERGALFEIDSGDGGASFASALLRAMRELVEEPSAEPTQRRIVVLSDEDPYFPDDRVAKRDARREARRLARYGIRLDMYGVGPQASRRERVFGELAELASGDFVPVAEPEEIRRVVERTRLGGLAGVELRNRTSGREGRAARAFSDGFYDGFVPLVDGENVIEVVALLEDDTRISGTVTVLYESPGAPTTEERRAASELLDRLRARTVETELLLDQDAARRRSGSGEVELEVDGDGEGARPAPRPSAPGGPDDTSRGTPATPAAP